MNVEHEVKLLVQELKRLGTPNADGQIAVKFGVLFNDDRCANIFEGEVISHCKDLKCLGRGRSRERVQEMCTHPPRCSLLFQIHFQNLFTSPVSYATP